MTIKLLCASLFVLTLLASSFWESAASSYMPGSQVASSVR